MERSQDLLLGDRERLVVLGDDTVAVLELEDVVVAEQDLDVPVARAQAVEHRRDGPLGRTSEGVSTLVGCDQHDGIMEDGSDGGR
ncbi:hypothetical protein [Actinacidiphila acidipaludis]|uniref:Uncharacterized protein n=1 Tax=Actinacidiphila acidipaludis TaxID=2873382 RepID=A0ABS7Q8S6_9ACTN|nr:hypothetical protein [Streptomyces acidipaludis]MBY8879577.1 hypothetical protein [Streptomyces acidipaludis]